MTAFSLQDDRRVTIEGIPSEVVDLRGPGLWAAVVPRAGGEAASLRIMFEGAWVETIHRALDYSEPSGHWQGRAPLLWPAVGRSRPPEELAQAAAKDLPTGAWRHEGRRYPMPMHGFARFMAFDVTEAEAGGRSAWVELRATDTDYTRQYYPFRFELTCRHIVEEGRLRTRYTVRNAESQRPMPFSIGNHIAFRLPFTERGRFEECVLTSPTTERIELIPPGIASGRRLPKDLRDGLALDDSELWNMVVCGFPDRRPSVELRDPHAFGVRVSQEVIGHTRGVTGDDLFFVFWAESGHHSFCPEPWLGLPNSLNTGDGVIRLPAGEEWSWEMAVTALLD